MSNDNPTPEPSPEVRQESKFGKREFTTEAIQMVGTEFKHMKGAFFHLIKNPAEGMKDVSDSIKNHMRFALFTIISISLVFGILVSLTKPLGGLFSSEGSSGFGVFFKSFFFLFLFSVVSSLSLMLVRRFFLKVHSGKWYDDFFMTSVAMFPLVPGTLITFILWIILETQIALLFFLFSGFLMFLLVFNGLKFICKVKDGPATYSISIAYILTILLLMILDNIL